MRPGVVIRLGVHVQQSRSIAVVKYVAKLASFVLDILIFLREDRSCILHMTVIILKRVVFFSFL